MSVLSTCPTTFAQPSVFDFHTGSHLEFPTHTKAKQALRYAKTYLSDQPELRPEQFPDHLREEGLGPAG